MNHLSYLRRSPLPLLLCLKSSHVSLRSISFNPPNRSDANPLPIARTETPFLTVAAEPFFSNIIPPDVYRCNRMLSALGRRRGLDEARALFDRMPQRDVVTYASMITLYLQSGNLPQAEALFWQAPARNVVLGSAMIDGYVKAGRIDEARKIFDAMPDRNVVSWTSLVSGYCRVGRTDEARRLFDQMPERNVVSWTTMVFGYARNGMLIEARELFDRMPERNVVSWTAMIRGCVENGRIREARELFDRMPHRNVYSWNVMISGYLDTKQASEAMDLFQLMPQRNAISWTVMVTGLARNGLMEKAREFFDMMPKKDTAAWNAIITAYAEEGRMSDVQELFDLMPDRNVVSWNVVIHGYAKNGYREEALRLFLIMLRSPVKQNETTLTSVLGMCQSNVEVKQIHGQAIKIGYERDTSLMNALVTMYSRSGDLGSAWLAFKTLDAKDVVSWTSMILACSHHGHGDCALEVFAQMLRRGAKPDGITFVGVLSACSHVGLVDKGKRIFNSMSRAYGLEPKAEHYSCLVDLLGRAGLVEEAKEVVSEMPQGELDEAVLGALLGACRVHEKIEVASHVGEELIELDPSGSGGYVLLANVFASHGKWNDVARVRKVMREKKVKKVPGFSQIEVKMRNHVFYVGDRSHPQAKEIYGMLKEVLLPQMKEMEYLHMIQSLPN
ncbi:uncharacterized protein [Elaeis guineensis]|uniref:uncharacterized protein n=1 Tax=Elaeis guineensis var. tenera TaxID=51953 RepID=UPI003C6D9315